MTDENDGTLRAVVWSDLCPWLILFRSFRIAIDFRVLLLSAAAAVVTATGWTLIPAIFSGDPVIGEQIAAETKCPWLRLSRLVPDTPGGEVASSFSPSLLERSSTTLGPAEPWFGTWEQLGGPFRRMFSFDGNATAGPGGDSQAGSGVSWFVCLLLCGLWGLATWAFFAAAVTRCAAVQLACEERIGLGEMLRWAASRWRAYFAAPLLPLLGVFFCTLPIAIVGLFLWFDFSILVAAVFWPLALLGGLCMAWLLFGLLFGWPLMFAAISAEGTDSFDAVSRSYEYLLRHPLRYLFYVAVATFVGMLGWLLVSNFAAAAVALTYWAASWGGSAERVGLVINGSEELGILGSFGVSLIHFWCECLKLLAVGFLYSFFWTSSTAVYLLLRRDEDAKEMDDVYLEDEEEQQPQGLPPLETDEAGALGATDDAPTDP
jgi:hypothetical protein